MHQIYPAKERVISIDSVSRTRGRRKPGPRSTLEIQQSISSNYTAMIEDVRLEIVARWRRGVRIPLLAKIFQRTVAEIEAVIWTHLYGSTDPFGGSHSLRRAA